MFFFADETKKTTELEYFYRKMCKFAELKKSIMSKPIKIVYITPSIHTADGAARVLTMKANYFAEHFGYDITILLTEGKGLNA